MVTTLSFAKATRCVEQVQQRLMRTVQALENAKVPFCVVGGNAVAVWVGSVDEGAVRNTKDVDILLRREDMDRAAAAMAAIGFERADVHGVTMFLDREDPMPSRAVHVVFAGERVRPHYTHPAPDVANVIRSAEGVPAIALEELLAMKLQSYRRIDQVHLLDMLNVGLIEEEMVRRLPTDLRQRLEELRQSTDE